MTEKVTDQTTGDIVIYQTQDGLTQINVKLKMKRFGLHNNKMAALFQTSRTNIVEHIKHIYEENELDDGQQI